MFNKVSIDLYEENRSRLKIHAQARMQKPGFAGKS
jgi:hypothetical protein